MKWYEKQKQLYEDKMKNDEPVNKETGTPSDSQSEEWKEDEKRMETEDVKDKVEEMVASSGYGQDRVSQPYTEDAKREITKIQSKTTLRGNIETSDDVVIYGTLIGDILCEGDIFIYGTVQGNISCHNATFKEAKVEGDIECSSSLELSEKSILHGNVKVINMENGGQIKGDVIVEETAHFLNASAIIGNITALEIQVDRGCIIQGSISITEKINF